MHLLLHLFLEHQLLSAQLCCCNHGTQRTPYAQSNVWLKRARVCVCPKASDPDRALCTFHDCIFPNSSLSSSSLPSSTSFLLFVLHFCYPGYKWCFISSPTLYKWSSIGRSRELLECFTRSTQTSLMNFGEKAFRQGDG